MERNILKSALVDALIEGDERLEKEFGEILQFAENDPRGSEEFGQALLLSAMISSQEAIKLIKINKSPMGPAPDEFKDKWAGLELLAIRIPEGYSKDLNFLTREIYPERETYAVYIPYAINKLEPQSPEAAKWFKANVPAGDALFGFGSEEVEIIV